MDKFTLIFGFVVAALCDSVVAADSPSEEKSADAASIPLDQVWAYGMPGTVDISKVVPDSHKIAIEQMRRSLSREASRDSQASPAFAVKGRGIAAFIRAKAALVDGNKPKQSFHPHDEISVVFFSRWFGQYVYLDAIEKSGNVIQIAYRFVPHEESNVSQHFALIPIGKVPVGKYQVKIVQTPMDVALLKRGFRPPAGDVVKSVICQSSEFEVTD